MHSAKSDDELMEAMRAGDLSAFDELFGRHRGAVFGYCMRLFSGDRSLSEDISQDVWVKVVNHSANYESRGQFRAWLMTVTRNQAMSHFRSKKHEDSEPVDEEIPGTFDLEAAFLQSHDVARVKEAIDGLADNQRTALTLWMAEDLSGEEIAATMGTTVTAAKSYLARAKITLKKVLGGKR